MGTIRKIYMVKKRFNQISVIGIDSISSVDRKTLENWSHRPVRYLKNLPNSEMKVARFIGNSDCILVARNVTISAKLLQACPTLRFIGVAGTGTENVDSNFSTTKGIEVRGIDDYCNRETAEFVITTTLNAIRGLGQQFWSTSPKSLGDLKFGIVGMGRVGKEVARMVDALGGTVYYYSRKKILGRTGKKYAYLSLPDLLRTCDIISLHTPANTKILNKRHFKLLGTKPHLLVNVCKGKIWDEVAFKQWIKNQSNFLIVDWVAGRTLEIKKTKNVLIANQAAYSLPSVIDRRNKLLIKLTRKFAEGQK